MRILSNGGDGNGFGGGSILRETGENGFPFSAKYVWFGPKIPNSSLHDRDCCRPGVWSLTLI
jgi:hypothetical protein